VTQLVRFYYKQDTQQRAKVLRPIKFPFMLDMHDFCAPELQKKIRAYREKKLEKQREEEAEAKKAKLTHNETPSASAGAAAAAAGGDAEAKMEVEGAGAAEPMAVEEEDESAHATYQLTGVLTHKVSPCGCESRCGLSETHCRATSYGSLLSLHRRWAFPC
jgi:ubiquitin carboxyl-terminal hydrolase 14